MRRLTLLIALPALLVAVFIGCTKEREIAGPGDDMTCIGCHSDAAALQELTSAGKWVPPASGREDG
ncbi:hypothetical protein H8E52_02490 [bacterium]|nr:hypothetical protein [bacterium]